MADKSYYFVYLLRIQFLNINKNTFISKKLLEMYDQLSKTD